MTSHRTIRFLLAAILAIPLLTAGVGCGDDDDPVTPPPDDGAIATIGTAGGTLAIDDVMTLNVPAGALDADVEFTADAVDAPPALPSGWVAVSGTCEIGPSGTTFTNPAALTLAYDPGAIPAFVPEDDVELFTHDGTAWSSLGGTVDPDADVIVGAVDHLSQFVVVVPEPDPAPDVFLEFTIERKLYGAPGGVRDGWDALSARFQSTVPGKIADDPDAGDVAYGPWALRYGMGSYYYSSDTTPLFLDLATNYDLVVEGSLEVTPLTLAVATMAGVPSITSVADGGDVSLDGFEVTWDGTDQPGDVEIHLESDAGGAMYRTDGNDGSFTFSAQSLAGLSAGEGTITLVWLYETPLPGTGYFDGSRTRYRTANEIDVVFTGGGTNLQTSMESAVEYLAIPDATTGGPGTPVTSVINMPITGTIESVRVYLDISHAWMSDLIAKVRSPDGTELRVLFIGEGGETDGRMQGWYPDDFTPKDDLGQFAGESAGGDWTLTCQDYSYDEAGTLNIWRMEVTYR